MKFLLQIVFITVAAFVFELFLPWWSITFAAFAGGLLIKKSPSNEFTCLSKILELNLYIKPSKNEGTKAKNKNIDTVENAKYVIPFFILIHLKLIRNSNPKLNKKLIITETLAVPNKNSSPKNMVLKTKLSLLLLV